MSGSTIVYFGSIPYNWDVETVKSVVCGTGRVVDVRCMMEAPNKNKGFSFVEYATPEEAQNALRLLSAIRVQGGKRLRAELSKEGLRSSNGFTKPVLDLNRNLLPPNVILPEEILRNGPAPNTAQQQYGQQQQGGNVLDQLPPEFVQLMTTNTQFQQIVTQMINNGIELQQILEVTKPYFSNSNRAGNVSSVEVTPGYTQAQPLPDFLKNASSYLPKEPQNIFKAEDTVDEALKKFEPPLLIQLITNLKEVIDSTNTYNATQIIKEAPGLALASAQALLLMGFIDADVIQEAMAQISSEQAPASQSVSGASTPAPQPRVAIDPNWVGLQPHTVQKLSKMDKAQADMIAQVLKLSVEQISVLPPDQRSMIEQLRSEYL